MTGYLENLLFAFSSFWWFLVSLDCHTKLCFHDHMPPAFCMSLLSLAWTLVIGFRACPDNPGWSHLKILNLNTSAHGTGGVA